LTAFAGTIENLLSMHGKSLLSDSKESLQIKWASIDGTRRVIKNLPWVLAGWIQDAKYPDKWWSLSHGT
jgi:hypothetical protein